MSEQDNVEVIKRGYEAFAAGDVEAVMNSFDDDVEWIQPGESAISGTYHGKSEGMEYLGRLAEKSVTVKLDRILADGDMVVALTHITMGDESGHDADVFTLRDGKTVRVEIRGDTAMMERVYGKKLLTAG
jgi:ketosteroid isomerase-like protein